MLNSSFLFLSLLTLSLQTQARTLTLSEAIQTGLENSPRLQKSEAAVKESHWKKVETYNGFLPSVSLSANHLLGKQYQFVDVNFGGSDVTIPQIIPSNSWSLNASLPLFDGFASWNRTSAASLGEEAAQNEYSWARFQLEREVQIKYYQALAAQKLKAVSEANQSTLQEHLNQTRALKKGGAATSYDVLRVEVQINEAQSEVLRSEDDEVLSRQRLAQSLGIEEPIEKLEGELPVPDVSKVQKLQKESSTARKDLVALEQRAQASDKLTSSAKSFWVPKVALNGSWISYNNRNDDMYDQEAYRWAYTVGVTLNWPIFDIGTIARSEQTVAQKIQTEKTLVQAKQQSSVDFEFWKRRCIYSATLYRAKLSDLEKAQETVRLAKESYRAGARTSNDVLDSELELFRARAGVVTSQMNFAEALLNLEMAVGHTL